MSEEFGIQERTYSCFWYSIFNNETKKDIISRTVGQITDKLMQHWRWKHFIKNGEYTRLVNFLVKNSFSFLLQEFNDFDSGDLFLSNVEYEIIQFMKDITEDDTANILKINDEIKKQIQTYSRHEELVEKNKSSIISWSNGCACWNSISITKDPIKKGNTVNLDASMVLIPYPRSKVKKYLCLLDESPLYKYSFEAIYERREVPLLEGVLGWMLKTMETEEFKSMKEKYA